METQKKQTCFVAYSSEPPDLAESIEAAIDEIDSGQTVYISGWKSTGTTGKFIISAICEAIDLCDIFICDMTTLNNNVLFELGFATAKRKRIWIILNPNIKDAVTNYHKFNILTTVGYAEYSNSSNIVNAFYREEPFRDPEDAIIHKAIETLIGASIKPSLLYLKSEIDTDASIRLTRVVSDFPDSVIIDDPKEVSIQTLTWYAPRVKISLGVIVHFLSSTQTGYRFQNAKNSFVAGLAYGFGKSTLMLAHEPYTSPIDYSDLLRTHSTAKQCEAIAKPWINNIVSELANKISSAEEFRRKQLAYSKLGDISVGNPIAEHESEELLDYFIETTAYRDAINDKYSIFIGRRGSGKTAILYKLQNEIGMDKRNHICVIKPIDYELHGLVRMLKQTIPKSEKGYLIESFWKFLIYTEIAKSIYDKLTQKPPHYEPDSAEIELCSFCSDNTNIILQQFSIRLENAVAELLDLFNIQGAEAQRARISELLHNKVIANLRKLLGKVLSRCDKVSIIIDNLDKAWTHNENLDALSELLYGLLNVTQRITLDFKKSDSWRKAVNLSLLVFLRSDIFSKVIRRVPERDKIIYSRIYWNDKELLLRVIEERIIRSSKEVSNHNEIWSKYFCKDVADTQVREFIYCSILPRPRDIIYFVSASLETAINRRHVIIEEDDLLDGLKKYSQYVLETIIAESNDESLEGLLYEFVGGPPILYKEDIVDAMKRCSMDVGNYQYIKELLCDITFLGREVEHEKFIFQYDDDEKRKLEALSHRFLEKNLKIRERFSINIPFRSYLEITSGKTVIDIADFK